MPAPTRVVASYAPEDAHLWKELEKHLVGLKRAGVVETWSSAEVGPGDDWHKVVARHLDEACVLLLLLSADFFACGRCIDVEADRALANATARVIPIRLRAYDWDAVPFQHLHPLPADGTPVVRSPDRDTAWANIAAEIRRVVALPPRQEVRRAPHNLPPRRLFVGREDELKLVDEALAREGRSSIAQQTAVWGLGGVGKTALALRYAYDALDAGTYPGGIFWVVAKGRPLDIVARLAGILREYAPGLLPDIPDQTPPAKVAEIVRRTLEDLPVPSLLVLDNVSKRWGAELLPGGQARVLMTLRDRRLGVGKAIALDVLSYEDARKLAIDLVEEEPKGSDEEDALRRVLEQQLGGLAVAVEVAARAVKEWARSWVEYGKLLITQPKDALDAPEDRSPNYDPGVFAALDLSIDRCGEDARKLLDGAAVFAPESVPLDWAHNAAGLDAKNIRTKRALGELEALRLMKVDDKTGTLSMHRPIHKRVRHRVAAEAWGAASMRAVEPVGNWIQSTAGLAKEQRDAIEARREHIMEALTAAERVGNTEAWGLIADGLSEHLLHQAEYDEARALRERALAVNEKTYGPDHPKVARSLSGLANVLVDLGEAAQARSLMERALAIAEKTYGSDHPRVAMYLSNLALVLKHLGETAQARPLMERALAIAERTYGPAHLGVAPHLSNLATVLRVLREAAQARPLMERALTIAERTYGSDHPRVAMCMFNLALVLMNLREAAQALTLLERAVAISERALPPAHPNLARYRVQLAVVRAALGERPPPER